MSDWLRTCQGYWWMVLISSNAPRHKKMRQAAESIHGMESNY